MVGCGDGERDSEDADLNFESTVLLPPAELDFVGPPLMFTLMLLFPRMVDGLLETEPDLAEEEFLPDTLAA